MSFQVRIETSYGGNINNSNCMKRGKKLETIWKSNSDVKLIQEWGQKIQSQAKRDVPVRTGNLRDSIMLENTSTGFRFWVDQAKAPYGKYIERGTSRMNPQPFFYSSIDRNKQGLIEALKKHYKGL